MTLTVRLDLSPEQEAQLRDSIARHDTARVRRLLTEAITPTVESLLQQGFEQPEDDEFEAEANQLADLFSSAVTSSTPILSDEVVSRAGIYEDHP